MERLYPLHSFHQQRWSHKVDPDNRPFAGGAIKVGYDGWAAERKVHGKGITIRIE